jgi:LPXTG-motif cell wall-anchored protein
MKRLILATSTMFLLTAGAAMAQNPLNTTAPGPTQETHPGDTNNDLRNPGSPQNQHNVQGAPRPVTENGTVEGTANESVQREQGTSTGTTGTTTGTMNSTGSTTGSGYGTTTGSTGTSTSTSTDTTTTGMNDTTGTSGRLPRTGSEMPLVALLGMASLAGAFALRSKRNA